MTSSRIEELFTRLAENKKELKRLKAITTEALKSSKPWATITEEINEAREKRKRIEDTVLADYSETLNDIEKLKLEVANDQMIISDIALNALMRGESIAVNDADGNVRWEPNIKITFKQQSLF